jgi:hypothetical protein
VDDRRLRPLAFVSVSLLSRSFRRSTGLAVCGLLALTACSSSPAASRLPATPTPTGSGAQSTSAAPTSTGGTGAPASGAPSAAPTFSPNPSLTGSQALSGSSSGLFLFAALQHDRLLGVDTAQLIDPTSSKVTQRWASPAFGAALAAVTTPAAVYAVSSNTPDLARIDFATNKLASVTVPPAGSVGTATFGSVFLLGSRVYVSYALGNNDEAASFDATTLRAITATSFPDPLADYTQMCAIDSTHLAMVESNSIRILDSSTLHSEATVAVKPSPSGIACADRRAYVSNFDSPTGVVIDKAAHVTGHFSWQGHGSDTLVADAKHGVLYGTDEFAKVLVVCSLTALTCRQSAPLGSKPTSVAVVNDDIVVDLENAEQLVVVDRKTLNVVRRLQLNDLPRVAIFIK